MKGLFVKDLKLMMLQKNFLLLILAIVIGMMIFTDDVIFPLGFLSFIVSLFTVSTISYDDFDNGNAFLFTLPITRNHYVSEKYFLGLLLGCMAWVLATVLGIITRSYNQMDNNEVVTEEVAAVVENNTGIEIEPLFEEQVDFDTFSKSDFRVVKVKNCEAVPKSKKLLRFTLDDGTENERTILSGVHAFYEPEELVGKTLLAIVNLPPRSMMGIDSCGMLLSAIHNVNGEEKLNLVMLDDAIPAGAKLY